MNRRSCLGRWLGAGAGAALLVLLVACGSGGSSPPFSLTTVPDFATSLDHATVSGSMSLPAGSERLGGTPTMPIVTCQIGAYTLTWVNAANGATGNAVALWDCPQDFAHWLASGIALAPGANSITFTLTDATRTATATIVVTRT